MWKARVFTLYPELFPGPLGSGIYKKALEKNIWSLEIINIKMEKLFIWKLVLRNYKNKRKEVNRYA